jgi:hypothetical protein
MPGAKSARLGAEVRSPRRLCPRKQRGLAEGRRLALLLPAAAALLLLWACSPPPCPRCNVVLARFMQEKAWTPETGARPGPDLERLAPEHREQLRELGYVE